MSEEKQESNKKRGIILWIIIALLMGTNGYTVWLLSKEKDHVVEQKIVTETIIVERDSRSLCYDKEALDARKEFKPGRQCC